MAPVSVAEYKLLGNLLLVTVVSFFGLALPIYAWLRKRHPEIDWNREGNVGTSTIEPLDLVVVAGYLSLWLFQWKGLPQAMLSAQTTPPTVSGAASSGVFLLVLAAVVPLVMFWRTSLVEFFGLRWKGWPCLFWLIPLFVIGFFCLAVLLDQLGWMKWVSAEFHAQKQDSVKLLSETRNLGMVLALTFSAVIAAPIAEEVIFRGYLYPVVKRFSDRWFAALFTGMFFGVAHFNLFSLPILFAMGVALVLLYEWTGSIWVTIACHAGFNGATVCLIMFAKLAGVTLPQ